MRGRLFEANDRAQPQSALTGPQASFTVARTDADAVEKYLPRPIEKRTGIGLCLSGGGFRAALFHLGAARRLNELGILSQLATISSVSGGSILAAFMADRLRPWPEPGGVVTDWENRVSGPFRRFTSRNLRTGPILKRLLPWNWFRESTGVEALASAYRERLTPMRLRDLPDRPNFVLCATDMAFGANWMFERDRMGDFQAGYVGPPADWPLARSVAGSSCFPPVFNPLPVALRPEDLTGGKMSPSSKRNEMLSDLRLTDGGNYDNLGLEPVWKTHAVVLVSDGGATFDFHSDKNLVWRLSRYAAIQANQAEAVRKRWLIASFIKGTLQGTYWGIGTAPSRYGPGSPPVYSTLVVEDFIAEIRTDMDAFSEAESKVLENHGYLVADAAVRAHTASLVVPGSSPELRIPHPDWMDEKRVRGALRESHRRKLPFGRY